MVQPKRVRIHFPSSFLCYSLLTRYFSDQLWTNDGLFRPVTPDQQYPPDLDDYPEHGEGWQNEDGVRIDMEHRRVPKVPRRSALKQGNSPPLSR
jgi:hypothetical protein